MNYNSYYSEGVEVEQDAMDSCGIPGWDKVDALVLALIVPKGSPGQYFNISSQYQYQSKTDNTIITILNSQYIEYSIYRLSAFF